MKIIKRNLPLALAILAGILSFYTFEAESFGVAAVTAVSALAIGKISLKCNEI